MSIIQDFKTVKQAYQRGDMGIWDSIHLFFEYIVLDIKSFFDFIRDITLYKVLLVCKILNVVLLALVTLFLILIYCNLHSNMEPVSRNIKHLSDSIDYRTNISPKVGEEIK